MFQKIIDNWGNNKLDVTDMAVVIVFLGFLTSFFTGSISLKKSKKKRG